MLEDFCNEDQRQQGWRGKQGKCAMHHAGGNFNNEAFLDLPHQFNHQTSPTKVALVSEESADVLSLGSPELFGTLR